MVEREYVDTKRIDGASMEDVTARVRLALTTEGFGVDIFEGDDGAVYIQTPRPTVMFGLVGNPAIKPIADEVDQKLRGVLDRI